jgi:SAM-dependent methyltransferase
MDVVEPPGISSLRPFYGRFAWAYDLLTERPIAAECAEIAAILAARGVPRGALLDAGCGTGRHAVELSRGYRVTGLDASPDLLAVARNRASGLVEFEQGDLTALTAAAAYDAILCRGVLNDLVDDAMRDAALAGFARALVPGGVLVVDVREWQATVRRKTAEPLHERTVDTPRGLLTFRSWTRLDRATQRMLIAESHALTSDGRTTVTEHAFVMRCWTRDELEARLSRAGFAAAEYRGAYDRTTPVGATDRLVVVASRLGQFAGTVTQGSGHEATFG